MTTETVKYINENRFIENLDASKYSMWHREANKCNNKCDPGPQTSLKCQFVKIEIYTSSES